MKVHLIGGPGSGKSSIVQELSMRYNVPAYDLDDIYWDRDADGFCFRASDAERDAALCAIVGRRS